MSFENHIFISYAHIDNKPLAEGQEGWITDLHRALEFRLSQLWGENPKVWRDLKLQGNDYFDDTIVEQFPKVALLISVLSPRYVKSKWCVQELREFCKAAEQTGGVRVANKSRIFKVIKTPLDSRDLHPQEMQGLLGYEFYKYNREGKFREFSKIFGSDAEKNFWEKLEDLAQDIYQLLKMIVSKDNGVVEQTVKQSGTSIYLAETTFELMDERNKIKRELQQRGYTVFPEQSLPYYCPDFEQVVRKNLACCKLSIHLIGARYGVVPEGAEQSVITLQHELALAYSQEHPCFLRLVWMPVELQAQDPRQKELIEFLQDDPNLLRTTLEELKTIIQDKLHPQPQQAQDAIAEDRPVRVYLICDQRDLEAITPLYDHLFDQRFEVMLPLFEGDETQVRQEHQDSLRLCDAVMIYHGNANELWLRTKQGDLQKVAGYGRSKPMLAQAIYVAEPKTSQKQMFRTHEALVIKNFGAFSPDLLEPFVTQIAQRQGGLR